MKTLLAVSLITLKEGLRYRVLYGIVVCALVVMVSSLLLSGLFLRDILKVLLDLCLSATTIGGLLVPFFLTINLLARDIENRTIFTLLSKTVSRNIYIIGRFLGLAIMTLLILSILSGATFLTVVSATYLYPDHFFKNLSYIPIFTNLFTSFLGIMVLNSVVFLWCSLTTSSFLATLLTICTYLIGHTVEDMVHFMSLKTPGVEISQVTQTIVKASLYIFPNLASFDTKLDAAHSILMSGEELIFLLTYGGCYISIMLFLSVVIFRKRDVT